MPAIEHQARALWKYIDFVINSADMVIEPVHHPVGGRGSLVHQQPAHGGGTGNCRDNPEDGVGQPKVNAVYFLCRRVPSAQAQDYTYLFWKFKTESSSDSDLFHFSHPANAS